MTWSRRNIEAGLLGLAVITAMVAYAALDLAQSGRVGGGAFGYGLSLATLFAAAHLVTRWKAPAADPLLLPIAAALNGVGLVVIRRLDQASSSRALAPLQLGWAAVGVAAFAAVLLFVPDHRRLARYRYTLAALGLVLLLLPALPGVGTTINGARLWVRAGPFSVQPSEAAKLCLVIFFAAYLVEKREVLTGAARRVAGLHVPRGRDLGPVLLAWLGSVAVLVRERDLGSSLLFFGVFVVMLYIATERASWLLVGLMLFGAGTGGAYLMFDHVQQRVTTWVDPWSRATDAGFQLTQALFGFGTGGLLGTGLGRGQPGAVPYARTDFIFAATGEELGLVGLTAVLALFALFVARAMRVAFGTRDDVGRLLAAGLAITVGLQVFVVVGGVTRVIPLTGLTLPFVAYGGSSLVANYAIVALLLRISNAERST